MALPPGTTWSWGRLRLTATTAVPAGVASLSRGEWCVISVGEGVLTVSVHAPLPTRRHHSRHHCTRAAITHLHPVGLHVVVIAFLVETHSPAKHVRPGLIQGNIIKGHELASRVRHEIHLPQSDEDVLIAVQITSMSPMHFILFLR